MTCLPSSLPRGSALLRLFCPRISEATRLLPAVRRELVGAGSRFPLSTGLRIELVPIVEGGLFGYELVPDRKTHTYVTIGCDAMGEPTLRKTLYGDGARNALQLVTADGRTASRDAFTETYGTTHRDTRFPDWAAAAESAWAQLLVLFPERPRQPVVIGEHVHRVSRSGAVDSSFVLGEMGPVHSLLRRAKRGATGICLDGHAWRARRAGLPDGQTYGCCGGRLRRRRCTNRGRSRYLMRMAPATNTSIARSTLFCPIARSAHRTR